MCLFEDLQLIYEIIPNKKLLYLQTNKQVTDLKLNLLSVCVYFKASLHAAEDINT